mmetsp:Transcript_9270/g.33790  ORF Transcript_9270/g.33790 Transcript_9270/m.33790 type:complete len:388 (+) Transcript_9270:1621-2784(+)
MRRHRRRGAGVHPNRGDAGVFQKLLGPTHGARPQKLHAARGDDARDRAQGWRQRDRRTRRRGFKRRERAVQTHGHGDHHARHRKARHRGRGRAPGGAPRGRHPVFVPGADGRRRRRHARRVRNRRERVGDKGQAVSSPNLRHDQVASEQQIRGGAAAGCGSHRARRERDENVRGGAAHGPPRRGVVRVPRGGVPGGARVHSRRAQVHRQRHRHVEDDAAGEGPPPAADADPEEQAREGARELHRPRRADRGPRRGVRPRARVDAHLFRTSRDAQGDEEGYSTRHREHLWIHRESHRAPRRPRDAAKQPESAGATESRVHDGRDRHRRGDVLAVHRAARADERIPRAGVEHSKRRPQVARVFVRVHRRDGQRLRLRRHAAARGRAHGP